MTGRDFARDLLGVAQTRAQSKEWDYPESAGELRRLTGLEWRDLNLTPRRVANYTSYRLPAGEWMPIRLDELPMWDRAWATRQHGWLIIAGTDETPGNPWDLNNRWLSAPELDRESVERLAYTLFVDLKVGAMFYETDEPLLRYLAWVVPDNYTAAQFGLELPWPEGRSRRQFLWELRFMQALAQRLSELLELRQ